MIFDFFSQCITLLLLIIKQRRATYRTFKEKLLLALLLLDYSSEFCSILAQNVWSLSLFSKRARNLLAAHFADLSSVHINPVYCQTHQRIICSSVVRAVDCESEFLSQFRSQGHSSLRNPFYLSFTLYGNEALGPRLYGTCVFLRFPLTLPLLRHEWIVEVFKEK